MQQTALFRDREEAGKLLAKRLKQFQHDPNTLVLGLARGGVPVAYEIAVKLKLPLDVFIVRKLGVPLQEELAMGAITSGNVKVINDDIVDALNISAADMAEVEKIERAELIRREKHYHQSKNAHDIKDKNIILVDDGVATGSTMKAAILALKQHAPAAIILAVPVAAASTIVALRQMVDHLICLETPAPFYGVGMWYEDFAQTTDDEVCQLLQQTP